MVDIDGSFSQPHRIPAYPSETLFVRAVEAIYGAAIEPAQWPHALQTIADVSDDVGAIMIYNRDDGRYGVIETASLAPVVTEYVNAWSDRDIRAIRSSERGYFFARDIISDDDILTDTEMETDPFYTEFLARAGLQYFAAIMVSPDPHVEVAVSIQRRRSKPKFSENELALLRRLGPHIENALRLSLRLIDAEHTTHELGKSLSRIGIGVFALDRIGRVTFMNAAAEALVGNGLDLDKARLLIMDVAQPGASGAEPPSPVLQSARPQLIRRRSGIPVALHVLPVDGQSGSMPGLLTTVRTMVLAVDLDPGAPADPALVRDLLGLTLGEARVAALVGAGIAPREAAQRLSIAEETARTVLKRVFAKAGVSRQSELTALLSRLTLR